MYGRQSLWRGSAAVVLSALLLVGPRPGSVGAESPGETFIAPIAAGAPFVPERDHSTNVVARAGFLRRIDALETAVTELRSRSGVDGDSLAVIESELASVARALESKADETSVSPTAEFGIDVGVFPVDELRKMFYDDWNEPRSGGRRHRGTDLLAQFGVPLRAIEDGTVDLISSGSLGGNSVYLLGESGSRYYYAHLESFADIAEGDRIIAGEVIGTVGDSGNAHGSPHLHIQWDPTGESDWQNPYPLLAALFGEVEVPAPNAFGPPNARG